MCWGNIVHEGIARPAVFKDHYGDMHWQAVRFGHTIIFPAFYNKVMIVVKECCPYRWVRFSVSRTVQLNVRTLLWTD